MFEQHLGAKLTSKRDVSVVHSEYRFIKLPPAFKIGRKDMIKPT